MDKPRWCHLFAFATRKSIVILVPAIIFSLLSGTIVPINSFLVGKMFSKFTSYGEGQLTEEEFKKEVIKYILYMVAMGAGCWLSNAIAYTLWHLFGSMQAHCARETVYNALLDKPIEWYDRRKDGVKGLSTRLQSFVHDLQTATSQPMSIISQYLCSILGAFGLAMYLSWRLTLVIVAGVPIMLILVPIFSSRIQPNLNAENEKRSEAAKITANAFGAIETVKCYNGEQQEQHAYARAINDGAHFFNRQVFWNALQFSVMRLVTLSMFVQGFWYGNVLLNQGVLTASQILTAFWGAMLSVSLLMQIAPYLVLLERGMAAAHKLLVTVGQLESTQCTITYERPKSVTGDISFESVDFSYPTRPGFQALSCANLFFAAGEITYVIGNSGSGKSTIGQLLLKFYNANKGVIKLDGKDIQDIDTEFIRKHILLVEQDSTLFNAPVYENIFLGKREDVTVTAEQIVEAAEFANIKETIDQMPERFGTMIGAKGTTLSGGQRQRIALARAYIRDPNILILDESTSALDYVNRTAVLDAIRKWRKNKTTIVITHEIAQILAREYVYVLKEGRIVEEGFRVTLERNGDSHFCGFLKAAISQGKGDTTDNMESKTKSILGWKPDAVQENHFVEDVIDDYLDQDNPVPSQLLTPTVFSRTSPSNPKRQSMQLRSVVGPFARIVPAPLSPVLDWASLYSESTESLIIKSRRNSMIDAVMLMTPDFGQKFLKTLTESIMQRFSLLFKKQASQEPETDTQDGLIPNDWMEMHEQPFRRKGNAMDAKIGTKKTQTKGLYMTRPITLRRIIATIWPQLRGLKQRLYLFIAIVSAVVYALSTPMFSFVFSKLLSTFYITDNRTHLATVYSLEVLAVAFVDAFATFVSNTLFPHIGQIWCKNLRFQAMKRLLCQPKSFFELKENSISTLSECLDRHADEMQHILGRFLGIIFGAIVMLGASITWSLVSCWKLALVLLACSPVIWLAMVIMRRVSGKMDSRNLQAEENVGTIISETITSIKTVRALTLESRFKKKFRDANNQALRTSIMRAIFCGPFFGLSESLLLFVNALIIYYGSILIAAGQFELQSVLTTFVLLLFGVSNATMLVGSIPQISISQESAAKLLRLVYLSSKNHEDIGKEKLSTVDSIVFHYVSFAYHSRPNDFVLRDLNLKIDRGDCIAIVGMSGSGKSTLASLLVNMYELSPATDISFSGQSIHAIHTPTLRSLVVLVPQTTIIFPGTIHSNICYGLPEFSSLRSRNNARDAGLASGAHEFIVGLPGGYDTMIGEGGTALSGGQAQRIGLARALIRKPDVLVLDEVTSGLDAGAAAVVRETVEKLRLKNEEGMRRMTVVIITHSKEMMKLADRICVLERGKVIEEGAWEELIRSEKGALKDLIMALERED